MSTLQSHSTGLPPAQQAIREKCYHPSGTFVEFKEEELEQCIADRFEQMVRMHPNRLAVKTTTLELTYSALNQAANRVAHSTLGKLSIKNEPVALLLAGIPLITALFGVFKAGKIALILDPSFPAARLNYMLEDSGAKLLLTDSDYSSLASDLDLELFLDAPEPKSSSEPFDIDPPTPN